MRGFLGTEAPFGADLNLVIQIAMGAALLIGTYLARRRRYTAHALCQTAVLLLNLVLIALLMWPSFYRQVLPVLPAHLGHRYYAIATAHAAVGAVAELLGLYIALVAGTSLVPRKLCFRRWKLWMRTELALWWVVILTGVFVYYTWYLAPLSP